MSIQPPSLHHNLIALPTGQSAGDDVAERPRHRVVIRRHES